MICRTTRANVAQGIVQQLGQGANPGQGRLELVGQGGDEIGALLGELALPRGGEKQDRAPNEKHEAHQGEGDVDAPAAPSLAIAATREEDETGRGQRRHDRGRGIEEHVLADRRHRVVVDGFEVNAAAVAQIVYRHVSGDQLRHEFRCPHQPPTATSRLRIIDQVGYLMKIR